MLLRLIDSNVGLMASADSSSIIPATASLYRLGLYLYSRKQHFNSRYYPAGQRAFIKWNILAVKSKIGPFPFHPVRVLKDLPKLFPEDMTAESLSAGPAIHGATLKIKAAAILLVTPATSVSVESLVPLQNSGLGQCDGFKFDYKGQVIFERRVQKLKKDAQTNFACQKPLKRDHIQFLLRMNDEAKVQRSIKSLLHDKTR